MSRVDAIHVDGVVALFTIAAVLFCALFAGLVSAPSTSAGNLFASLQDSSRGSAGVGRTNLRKSLLAIEVGLTVVLLVCAGLLLKTYARLRSADMGCTTRNVLTLHLDVFGKQYGQRAQLVAFYNRLLEQVRALPGVQAASFTSAVPGEGYFGDTGFSIVEHAPLPPGQKQSAINRFVDSGYFSAMGIPLLRGRTFDPSKSLDNADESVISKSFAQLYFPGEDPLGKHLIILGHRMAIVGVVGDTRFQASEAPQPMQYYPLNLGVVNTGRLIVRSKGDVARQALPVQRVVDSIDHNLPVSSVLTMDQLLGRSVLDTSFNATLLLGFALLSLILASVGIFGVLSYIVAQRTTEIGIRLALGASRTQVLVQILFDGLRPALAGLVLGIIASASALRAIKSMLYETEPLDPLIFVSVAIMLLVVAAIACALPAWRAARTNPIQALRTE